MIRLPDIPMRCFQGVVPSVIATCAADGTPNVTYLSQVYYVDERHVALSCQFFHKTKTNVLENPYACIELYDPVTFEAYRLELRFDHAETSGALFEDMAIRIDAIASQAGMAGVFRLRSADVYEVVSAELRDGFLDGSALPAALLEAGAPPRNELRGIQLVSQCTRTACGLDDLLTSVLATLEEALGFQHGMVLMLDEPGHKLFVVASRGYDDTGVGAEVAVGEGLIGTVARERRILRMSGVENELRYGRAIRAGLQRTRAGRALTPEIPLAGLPDAESYLAMPLVAGDRLIGVLAVESRARLAFEDWHLAFLDIVANQVAVAIENVVLREREAIEDPAPAAPAALAAPAERAPARARAATQVGSKVLRYFCQDECVFVGDEYLIRNVPAKILWKLLREHAADGRTCFTNRELRLDPWIGLPALRDNLESRLVLLRKRLEEKCPEILLVSTGRGRFRLDVSCRVVLEEQGGA